MLHTRFEFLLKHDFLGANYFIYRFSDLVTNPNKKRFTWRRKNPFKQRLLDYFFISDTLQDTAERIEIILSVQSDHSTLCLKFSPINERNRGPSHWKFNSSLVYDKNFVRMIKIEIPKFCDESLGIKDAMGHWEFLRYKMRQLSMKYSKEKAAERKSKRIFLENSVKQLEIKILTNSNEELLEQYNIAKTNWRHYLIILQKESSFALKQTGMNMEKSPPNIFLILKKGTNLSLI